MNEIFRSSSSIPIRILFIFYFWLQFSLEKEYSCIIVAHIVVPRWFYLSAFNTKNKLALFNPTSILGDAIKSE